MTLLPQRISQTMRDDTAKQLSFVQGCGPSGIILRCVILNRSKGGLTASPLESLVTPKAHLRKRQDVGYYFLVCTRCVVCVIYCSTLMASKRYVSPRDRGSEGRNLPENAFLVTILRWISEKTLQFFCGEAVYGSTL